MRQTILIVDDSPTQTIFLRRILFQARYNHIATVKDGVEALEFLRNEGAALVLADINMPRMNGFELCAQIKSDPKLQFIPFIQRTRENSVL